MIILTATIGGEAPPARSTSAAPLLTHPDPPLARVVIQRHAKIILQKRRSKVRRVARSVSQRVRRKAHGGQDDETRCAGDLEQIADAVGAGVLDLGCRV